jgi:hypothetical protein
VDSVEAQQAIDSSPLLRPLAHLNSHSRHNSSPRPHTTRNASAPSSAGARHGGWSPTHNNNTAATTTAQGDAMLVVPGKLTSSSSGSHVPLRSHGAASQAVEVGVVTLGPAEPHVPSDSGLLEYVDCIGIWPSYLLTAHTAATADGSNSSSSSGGQDSRDSSSSAAVSLAPLSLGPSPFELKFDLSDVRTLSFDCWRYSEEELLLVSYAIFEDSGVIDEFGLQSDVLQCFLLNVRARYRTNPYHNWYHGFSVLQCTLNKHTLTNIRSL